MHAIPVRPRTPPRPRDSGRELIQAALDGEQDEDAVRAEAERVLEANWRLLDGVERAAAA